jgi:hypothetical protein
MKQISPIITPFRWYDEFYQQDRYKNDCDACEFKLITDRKHILPFQFKRLPSGFGIDKWLLRKSCVDAQNKLFTSKDNLFSSGNSWQNNGGFVFDCSNACSGTSVDSDELTYANVLTIGKTYTFNVVVNEFQVTTSGIFYKFYNGASFIQNINYAGLNQITFVAVSTDITLQFNAPNPIGDDYICITEAQITQSVEQLPEDIELDITKLKLANAGSYDYISYCGESFATTLPTGDYYCIIIDLNGNTFFSEIITIRDFVHEKPPYYILEWYNTCIIDDVIYGATSGCFYFNQLYLDEAIISKPEYPYKEEGEENGNQDFTATFQKWEKTIKFLVAKCPEFITDALSAITLHDNIYITEPIRKKQELSDGNTSIKSVEVDVQPVINDCFSNVEIKMLLNDKYVDSSCCLTSPIEQCLTCAEKADYVAPFYYNTLIDITPDFEGEIIYSLINDIGVGPIGLYIWNESEGLWNMVELAEDATCCAINEPYIWNGGQWHLIGSINSAIYVVDSYYVTGWAWPNSYVQIETSPDNIVWTPRTPIENAAVFNLVGIKILNGETPLYFRARIFTLNCEYGYGPIFNWTPLLLPKLTAWYKSDTGISQVDDLVTQWNDQSGSGYHLTQPTDGKNPLIVANQLNGYPALVFDGVNDSMQALFAQTQPVGVFIVFKNINDGTGVFVFDGGGIADRNALQLSGSSTETMRNNLTFSTTRYNWFGAFGVVSCVFDGAISYFKTPVQGVDITNVGTLNMDGLTIGSNGDETNFWSNVAIVEIIIQDKHGTTDELKQVRDYLKTKYLI